MKKRKEGVAVRRLDENRYAISLDQVIRYVDRKRNATAVPKSFCGKMDAMCKTGLWRGPAGWADCPNQCRLEPSSISAFLQEGSRAIEGSCKLYENLRERRRALATWLGRRLSRFHVKEQTFANSIAHDAVRLTVALLKISDNRLLSAFSAPPSFPYADPTASEAGQHGQLSHGYFQAGP